MVRKCLVCDTVIPMTQSFCPNCGWRYEKEKRHQVMSNQGDYHDSKKQKSVKTNKMDLNKQVKEVKSIVSQEENKDVLQKYFVEKSNESAKKTNKVVKIILYMAFIYWFMLFVLMVVRNISK